MQNLLVPQNKFINLIDEMYFEVYGTNLIPSVITDKGTGTCKIS